MASILKVDELQGITAAGDITITSEGGAATQSLQQGLAKAWINFNGTGTVAARDSHNVSSLVDTAAGRYQINFSTSMNNDDYAFSLARDGLPSQGFFSGDSSTATTTTSQFSTVGVNDANTALQDLPVASVLVHGDLA